MKIKPILLISLAALLIRLVWAFLALRLDPVLILNPLHGDAIGYDLLAKSLVAGTGFSWYGVVPISYRMPGYPAFLALIYVLFGDNLSVVRIVHAILGALLCFPVAGVAYQLGGQRTANLSALGVAVYPILIYIGGWVYAESLYILLLWIGLWVLLQAVQHEKIVFAIMGGGIWGLSTLVRPEIFPLPMVAGLFNMIVYRRSKALMHFGIAQLTIIMIVIPWSIRNTQVNGEFVLLTTSSGSNFYAGNNPKSNGGSAWVVPVDGLSELESDQILAQQGWQWIREDPSRAIRNEFKKLSKFFSPIEFETRDSPFGRWGWIVNLIYLTFIGLATWGILQNWRSQATTLMLSVITWYLFTALIFFGGSRVALPVMPALIIFSICGLGHLVAKSAK